MVAARGKLEDFANGMLSDPLSFLCFMLYFFCFLKCSWLVASTTIASTVGYGIKYRQIRPRR